MTEKRLNIIIFLISVFIAGVFIYLSIYLRSLGYSSIPEPYIADEYDYIWQAISLKKNGIPIAWSNLSGVYSDEKLRPRKGGIAGTSITVDGKTIDLSEFKKDSRPITAVTEINWGKGKEHMYFVAPFFYHSPVGGLILSMGMDNKISSFEDVRPWDFRKSALNIAILVSVLIFIYTLQVTKKPLIASLAVCIYSTVPTYVIATR
ncbi:MAG: hypothetical protein GYA62_08725, partial [Bacteroidales bacterium]|nr:hypothetical protein [Bacteroidales bacterium]